MCNISVNSVYRGYTTLSIDLQMWFSDHWFGI